MEKRIPKPEAVLRSLYDQDNLAKNMITFCGTVVGTTVLAGFISLVPSNSVILNILEEIRRPLFYGATGATIIGLGIKGFKNQIKDQKNLIHKINGIKKNGKDVQYATDNEKSAKYEENIRNEKNKAHKSDLTYPAIITGLSVLGLVLPLFKGEDPTKFMEKLSSLSPVFIGSCSASLIAFLSTVSRLYKNKKEKELIKDAYDITPIAMDSYREESGYRPDIEEVKKPKIKAKPKQKKK